MLRRYVAEFVGTFGIVFAPVALSSTIHHLGADSSLLAAALVSGLSVTAMIYALGHISSAHFNPAVTLGFAVSGRFPMRYVLPYWLAQFTGAIAASALCAALYGGGHGTNIPFSNSLTAVATETVLTFFLMLVIISVATDNRVDGAVPGIAIGATVVFDILIGGSISGASMNPARSLAPAVFAGHFALSSYWIYVVGPALGAVIASKLYEAIRGGETHVKSSPNDLLIALRQIEATVEPIKVTSG